MTPGWARRRSRTKRVASVRNRSETTPRRSSRDARGRAVANRSLRLLYLHCVSRIDGVRRHMTLYHDRDAFDDEENPVSTPDSHAAQQGAGKEIRRLDITDLERIERFRHAGYGGSVSDALNHLGVRNTVFSDRFKPLRQGMQIVGRALPIKLHSLVEPRTPEHQAALEARWAEEGGHPQKRMMKAV